MQAPADPAPRLGRFLVALERLERAQPPGVFLADRIEVAPDGVVLRRPSGTSIRLPADALIGPIAAALRDELPHLRIPEDDVEVPLSQEADVQTQWAQLHYALGAYEDGILEDRGVRVLVVERHGRTAAVQVSREPDGVVERYSLHLDREIDLGLADTIAFAPFSGRVDGSLDPR